MFHSNDCYKGIKERVRRAWLDKNRKKLFKFGDDRFELFSSKFSADEKLVFLHKTCRAVDYPRASRKKKRDALISRIRVLFVLVMTFNKITRRRRRRWKLAYKIKSVENAALVKISLSFISRRIRKMRVRNFQISVKFCNKTELSEIMRLWVILLLLCLQKNWLVSIII